MESPLTKRQLELLGHLASGKTIDEAAEQCIIAPRSAYNTLSSARDRADVKTVTQLTIRAVENGWLVKGDEGSYAPVAS